MTKTRISKGSPARTAAKPVKAAAPKRRGPNTRASKPRKAKPPKPKARIVRQKLDWRGVRLAVTYDPAYFPSVSFYSAHLEILVLSPEGAPLPITDTGYRSHFIPKAYVEESGGPAAYVTAWLDREASSPAYRRMLARWQQLDLFAQCGEARRRAR